MEIIYAVVVGQIAIIGMVFKWLHTQVRDNKLRVDKMIADSYSKEETKELVDMKLEPLAVGIAHVQDELKEVKSMIGRLLDEKNNKN